MLESVTYQQKKNVNAYANELLCEVNIAFPARTKSQNGLMSYLHIQEPSNQTFLLASSPQSNFLLELV